MFTCKASELEVLLFETNSDIKVLLSNSSLDNVLIESKLIFWDCSFVGNLCIEAKTLSGDNMPVHYSPKRFDVSFGDRFELRPSKITGVSLSKDKLSMMLKLKKDSSVYITVHYHNKSLDKVFSSKPTKVDIERRN